MQFKTKLLTSVTMLSLSLISQSASHAFGTADTIDQSPLQESFKQLDKDSDGTLNFKEASKDKLYSHKNFAKADVDHDGTLTQDEYSNYQSAHNNKEVKRLASDTEITTKIKASLVKEEGFKGFNVSVETVKGVVQLSGFVNDQALVTKAGEIASQTEGVKSVKNDLIVKG
jgi:hyperosmotically inducible protein